MRRPPITAILTAGACALSFAAPAAAQERTGQRYLAWPTKGAAASAPDAASGYAPTSTPTPASTTAPRRRAPIIPHGGFGRMPDTAPQQNLTPASAWLGPNAPTYQPVAPPQPYAAPAPTSWTRDLAPPAPTPAYVAAAAPAAGAAPTRATPQPQPQPQPQPVYAPAPPVAYAPPPEPTPAALPAPAPVAAAPADAASDAPAFDPMAPRRDAPIFRLQRAAPSEPPPAAPVQPQAAPAAQAQAQPAQQPLQAAPQEGARYYSVHRQAGRQPDATPLPQTVYLDALPVELTTPPATTDLAAPPAQPALIRNSNGRLQAAPDTEVQDQP